ncbi:MAG: hypothetical protein ACYDHX_06015 [Methanothrix sp.]
MGDWIRQRPRPSSSGARPEDLTMLEKGGDQAEGLEEEGGGAGNLNEVKIANFEIGIRWIVWGWISTTGSGLIMDWNLLLLKLLFSHRGFEGLRVIPWISHEGPRRREEAMIGDLWHYPAMKKELPFTLCVLCDLCG